MRRRGWILAAMLVATAACGGASNHGETRTGSRTRVVLASTQPVVFVPTWIDYSGATDVTDSLQNFLDSVPDNRTVLFHINGRYRVDGTLFVTFRNNMTYDGQNAAIFATTQGTIDRSQWFITGGSGIVFRHLAVRGANPHAGTGEAAYNPKFEKQHGFRVEGVQGFELDRVTVTDVYGDFVYLAREFISHEVAQPTTDVWIHDSTFRRDGRQGISVVCATDVIIERNTLADTRRSTIDLEPNGPQQTVSNVFILDNAVGAGRLLFIASHGRGPVNNIVISGNRLHKHVLNIDVLAPPDERRQNWIVTNNVSEVSAHFRPIRFFDTDGVLVSGNTQVITNNQPSVELNDVCTGRVENNDFGTAAVLRHGPSCSALLIIPKEPDIPGRG